MLVDEATSMAGCAWDNLLNQYVLFLLPLAVSNASCSATGLTFARRNTVFSSRTVTGGTGDRSHPTYRFFSTCRDALQRNVKVHLYICAALWTSLAVTEKTTEQVVAKIEIEPSKNILKIDTPEQILPAEPLHPGESARIILGPFLRIGQNCICLGNFLEAFLSSWLFIAVWMIFQRKGAESILDRFLVCVPWDAQYFVVVTLCGNSNSP
jgi:hypothetical protein